MSCNYSKLEIKKGYKTPFRRSSHICKSHDVSISAMLNSLHKRIMGEVPLQWD